MATKKTTKKPKAWAYKVNNRLRGAFGITDFGKRTVQINKKAHPKKIKKGKYGFAKGEMTQINTMVHEDLHRRHPKAHEKTVRKMAKKKVARMAPKAKARLRSKFK